MNTKKLNSLILDDERTVANVFIDKEKEWTEPDSSLYSRWHDTEWQNKHGSAEGHGEDVHVPNEQQVKTPKQILKFAIKRALGNAEQVRL